MKDYAEFENWWILQSKMPYRSQKEVAEMAFEAGRATIRELIAERDALLAELAKTKSERNNAWDDLADFDRAMLAKFDADAAESTDLFTWITNQQHKLAKAKEDIGRKSALVIRLANDLCCAVDLADEDIGGARTIKDILADLGPAVDDAMKEKP